MLLKTLHLTEEERLDELKIRHAILAGATAIGLSNSAVHEPIKNEPQSIAQVRKIDNQQTLNDHPLLMSAEAKRLVNLTDKVVKKFGNNVDEKEAKEIVASAIKHEDSSFPKAEDILGIISIESAFKKDAVSKLKYDPARGLMQVRPKIWGIPLSSFSTIDNHISVGANILKTYNNKLSNKYDAIHAYNVGITNFKRGAGLNPEYVTKFKTAQSYF